MLLAKVPAQAIQAFIKDNWYVLSVVGLLLLHLVFFKLITHENIKSTPAKVIIYILILALGVVTYSYLPIK